MMYNGKHSKKMKFKSKKTLTLLIALLVIFSVGVGSTLAYLVTTSGPVENVFTPGEVKGSIEENFENGVKSNVRVSIDSNSDVAGYVRAAIVVTWKDSKGGNVYGQQPVLGTDYSMTLNTSNWQLINGYYYHKGAVNPGASTAALIEDCRQLQACVDSKYKLDVEIIAEVIQAEPEAAVNEAWPAGASYVKGN